MFGRQHLQLVREPRALRHERGELLRHVAHQRERLDRAQVARLLEHADPAAQEGILGGELA